MNETNYGQQSAQNLPFKCDLKKAECLSRFAVLVKLRVRNINLLTNVTTVKRIATDKHVYMSKNYTAKSFNAISKLRNFISRMPNFMIVKPKIRQ